MLPPFEDFTEAVALIVLAAILFRVGAAMSQSRPRVQTWAWRMTAGTFVLDGLLFVSDRADASIATCLAAAIHALIVAGAAMGAYLIAFSGFSVVTDCFSGLAARAEQKARARRDARERAKNERREAAERRRRDAEWERTRPERERQQREATERHAVELRQKNADQKRRESARLRCETHYSIQAPVIGNRFTKATFDTFVAKYMADTRPPDEVEERAEQLCSLIAQHTHAIAPQIKQADLGELATWFINERERLESLPLDDEVKEEHRGKLEFRYAELCEELLEKMRP